MFLVISHNPHSRLTPITFPPLSSGSHPFDDQVDNPYTYIPATPSCYPWQAWSVSRKGALANFLRKERCIPPPPPHPILYSILVPILSPTFVHTLTHPNITSSHTHFRSPSRPTNPLTHPTSFGCINYNSLSHSLSHSLTHPLTHPSPF